MYDDISRASMMTLSGEKMTSVRCLCIYILESITKSTDRIFLSSTGHTPISEDFMIYKG